jgi:hypothetical protein
LAKAIFSKAILPKLLPSAFLFHSSDFAGPILYCTVGFCAGLYLFFNGFRLLKRRRMILDTPVSKIRSASMGMVELSGLAVGPYTMNAPVTGHPCYYFRTVVWEYKRQDNNRSNKWVKVAAECMHVPFFLDDNTGQVMIDPRGAELDLHCDFQQQFSNSFFTTKEEIPPNVCLLLSRHGIDITGKIKVEEFCIKPKNALFLLGTLGDNPGLELTPQPIVDDDYSTLTLGNALWFNPVRAALESNMLSFASGGGHDYSAPLEESTAGPSAAVSAFRNTSSAPSKYVIKLSPDSAPTKLEEMTQQQKIAAALMKAGISNPAAWVTAGVAPATPTSVTNQPSHGKPSAAGVGFDSHPPVVLKKGTKNPTFLISWRSQRAIARSLGWKCTLMIWGGPALALLCLYGILTLTNLI